jgi:hypothetical protein
MITRKVITAVGLLSLAVVGTTFAGPANAASSTDVKTKTSQSIKDSHIKVGQPLVIKVTVSVPKHKPDAEGFIAIRTAETGYVWCDYLDASDDGKLTVVIDTTSGYFPYSGEFHVQAQFSDYPQCDWFDTAKRPSTLVEGPVAFKGSISSTKEVHVKVNTIT